MSEEIWSAEKKASVCRRVDDNNDFSYPTFAFAFAFDWRKKKRCDTRKKFVTFWSWKSGHNK